MLSLLMYTGNSAILDYYYGPEQSKQILGYSFIYLVKMKYKYRKKENTVNLYMYMKMDYVLTISIITNGNTFVMKQLKCDSP